VRYFKDVTKNNKLICVWKNKDEQVIANRVDSQSKEILKKEFDDITLAINKGDIK